MLYQQALSQIAQITEVHGVTVDDGFSKVEELGRAFDQDRQLLEALLADAADREAELSNPPPELRRSLERMRDSAVQDIRSAASPTRDRAGLTVTICNRLLAQPK